MQALLAKRSPTPDVPATITPLSETRHRVQLTASDELRKKLDRAQDLMRHANAEGDLAVVVERAVDLLLEKLEKQRLGKTSRPRPSPEPSDPARVSRPTRRAVFERDGERCTFTDAEGHRCSATTWLELDHVVPKARGGASDRDGGDPRQRGYASDRCDAVSARRPAEELTTVPVQTILREALAIRSPAPAGPPRATRRRAAASAPRRPATTR